MASRTTPSKSKTAAGAIPEIASFARICVRTAPTMMHIRSAAPNVARIGTQIPAIKPRAATISSTPVRTKNQTGKWFL